MDQLISDQWNQSMKEAEKECDDIEDLPPELRVELMQFLEDALLEEIAKEGFKKKLKLVFFDLSEKYFFFLEEEILEQYAEVEKLEQAGLMNFFTDEQNEDACGFLNPLWI